LGALNRADSAAIDEESFFRKYLELYSLKKEDLFEGEEESIRTKAKDYKRSVAAYEFKREQCALIVVDMQNDFVKPHAPLWIPEATRQVPLIKKLIESCRELKIPVIYTTHTIAPDCSADFYEFSDAMRKGAIREGSVGADIYPELYPKKGERVITAKHSFSAMLGTDLDYVLRNRNVKTVLMCGTLTNYCVESTARDAYGLDYHVAMISDCCSTDNPFCHQATLDTLRRGWARVLTSEELIRIFRGNDSRVPDRVSESQLLVEKSR
jgi:nicotinamidase-related amidase